MKDEMSRRIEIRQVTTAKELKEFIAFPWRIYREDRNWVPPLISDIEARLDIKRNPFWRTAERELWLAWQGNQPVGASPPLLTGRATRLLTKRSVFLLF